jgi:hypothetical protein
MPGLKLRPVAPMFVFDDDDQVVGVVDTDQVGKVQALATAAEGEEVVWWLRWDKGWLALTEAEIRKHMVQVEV